MNEKHFILISSIFLLLSFIVWIIWGNTAIELNTYSIASSVLPKAFVGYRIAHISDLHNAQIGNDNFKLLTILNDAQPNIIVMTGDLIDSRNTDIKIALHFANEAMKIAPCYYVAGNHESRIFEYEDFKTKLEELGVVVLDDKSQVIYSGQDEIILLGVKDPNFETNKILDDTVIVKNKVEKLLKNANGFTILLSHRPDFFDIYVESRIDLVFSGHIHGGQFRLPFIGGLYAPHQGFFPKFDGGLYTDNGTNMVVSRGIGNSLFPFRINNRPEVLLIELNLI